MPEVWGNIECDECRRVQGPYGIWHGTRGRVYCSSNCHYQGEMING